MTEEKMIEELLIEASNIGVRSEVLNVSKKYIDQGMSRFQALTTAFNEIVNTKGIFSH